MNNLKQLLESYGYKPTNLEFSLFEAYKEFCDEFYKDYKVVLGGGDKVELIKIDSFGGEGKGDQYWIVFSVKFNGKDLGTYKLDGWYASYNGHEFDDYYAFYEVEQKEVVTKKWVLKI